MTKLSPGSSLDRGMINLGSTFVLANQPLESKINTRSINKAASYSRDRAFDSRCFRQPVGDLTDAEPDRRDERARKRPEVLTFLRLLLLHGSSSPPPPSYTTSTTVYAACKLEFIVSVIKQKQYGVKKHAGNLIEHVPVANQSAAEHNFQLYLAKLQIDFYEPGAQWRRTASRRRNDSVTWATRGTE
ncbi:hypothetical protein KQX54_017891 [Cotesia glomerata]|uniref:Uncharacterized protein n=1 Tax=Cotesia glomerata TaxID=32391 RepID=A0AAV7I0Z4_COTGL|nr:hypothetical protein KQX54_017891 [Cotesia glomerata]